MSVGIVAALWIARTRCVGTTTVVPRSFGGAGRSTDEIGWRAGSHARPLRRRHGDPVLPASATAARDRREAAAADRGPRLTPRTSVSSVVVVVLVLSACTTPTVDAADEARDPPTAVTTDAAVPDWPWELAAAGEDVPASVPLEEIRRGGPPPDGIPPIDDPVFEDVAAAGGWLGPRDPVLVVDHGDEPRAYPLAIMTYHEIVNDVVAGTPLVVTYCPLCNSGLVFERTVDGEVLDFGTSGRLYNSNLVMYDRATRSLWSQFTGEAIVGPQLGATLVRVPMQIVGFAEVAERWPDAQVLSRDTGHERPYGDNPYVGYDSAASPFLFDGDTGGPLAQMTRVVTTGGDVDPVAFPWDVLIRERSLTAIVDGAPVVALWAPGAASALDGARIADSDDIGAAGVFRPRAHGRRLTFSPDGGGRFVDDQTGSTWSVTGSAVSGPLQGIQLRRVPHDDTFWFVQFAFRPDTRVVGAD
jgi:hypothetical protein